MSGDQIMQTPVIKSWKWALVSGALVWLVPFIAGMVLSAVRASDRLLFETIMPVILAITAMVFLTIRRTAASSLLRGLMLGGIWLTMSIGLDLVMFMWGPMKMSFADYMKDIGLTYLMYPVITAGTGWLSSKSRCSSSDD